MKTKPKQQKWLIAFCLISLLFSLSAFTYRNYKNFYQTPIDFLIFLRAGQLYNETGQLYQRSDNYADTYHPSAAIFKFPPAFQLMLIPLTKLPASVDLYVFTRLLLTSMYVLSIALLFFYLQKNLRLDGRQTFYFGSLLFSIACWLMPFFECIRWLLTEIPLLFLFIISFLLLNRSRFASSLSGALMAYAASAKIYPAFLFGHHLLQKNRAAFWGFIIGLVLTTATALYCYGLDEHLFYIKNILPILLDEAVTDKWVNLNLEKFLFIIGVLPEVSGHVFYVLRIFFVGTLFVVLYTHKKPHEKNPFLIFSLFITTMFFCFPNYWPQYQIFLIIPIALLIALYIKNHQTVLLGILLISSSTLFVPDLLWQEILNWDAARQGLDIEMIGKECYQNGTGTTLLKYSSLTWLMYFSYEYRALAPLALWLLQVLQFRKSHG